MPIHLKKKRLTSAMDITESSLEHNLKVCPLFLPHFLNIVHDVYINISAYIQFQLGYSSASGMTRTIKPLNHPHVLHVTLTRGIWTNVFFKLILLLPLAIQRIARATWPAYFLPDVVVVKKLKPGWDDEFQNEQDMYKKLEPLQGRVIPIFYGEARCEGTRALILSKVPGVNSINQGPRPLDWEQYARRLRVACGELARYGVVLDDYNITNIMVVDDAVMLVDLENYCDVEPETVEQFSGWAADEILSKYANYLKNVREGWET